MLVEAFIYRDQGPARPFSYMGVVAPDAESVRRAAIEMERIGVDIIGVMFSADPDHYSQEGASERLPLDVRDRIRLRSVRSRPDFARGPADACERD